MRKTTVLITGSSGLTGRALCHRLGDAGCQVIGFDKEGPPYPPPNTDCIFVDMSSDQSLQNAFHIVEDRYGNKIDIVVHLAAYYSFSGHPSPLYKKLTVDGTDRLLRELQRFQAGQFMFSSSMLPDARDSESTRIHPFWLPGLIQNPVKRLLTDPVHRYELNKLEAPQNLKHEHPEHKQDQHEHHGHGPEHRKTA